MTLLIFEKVFEQLAQIHGFLGMAERLEPNLAKTDQYINIRTRLGAAIHHPKWGTLRRAA
jgi:hypothetical protein